MATKVYRTNLLNSPENLPTTDKGRDPRTQNANAPLTEPQNRFVRHYVEDRMTQTAAARAAGFNRAGSTAYDMLRHPKIQRAIAERRAEYAAASMITKRMVMEGFQEAIAMAKLQAEPLTMIAGWREIGKLCGFYEPTKAELKITANGQVLHRRLSALSDDELLKLAESDDNVIDVVGVDIGETGSDDQDANQD